MKDQKDLPLPQTDLPLPEKEISAGAEAKEVSKNKWTLFIIIGLAILFATLIGGYLLAAENAVKPIACTAEAKICPDGSSVGRTGPKCEFTKCPDAIPTTNEAASPTPTCRPRPSCLDSKPRCMIAETADMCPPTITPTQ